MRTVTRNVNNTKLVVEERSAQIVNRRGMTSRQLDIVAVLAPTHTFRNGTILLAEPKRTGAPWVREHDQNGIFCAHALLLLKIGAKSVTAGVSFSGLL